MRNKYCVFCIFISRPLPRVLWFIVEFPFQFRIIMGILILYYIINFYVIGYNCR